MPKSQPGPGAIADEEISITTFAKADCFILADYQILAQMPQPSKIEQQGTQRVYVGASSDAALGAGQVIRFVLRDAVQVYRVRDCTLANPATACRTATGGAGRFALKVNFADDGFSLDSFETAGASDERGIYWYVGCAAAKDAAIVNIKLELFYSPVAR